MNLSSSISGNVLSLAIEPSAIMQSDSPIAFLALGVDLIPTRPRLMSSSSDIIPLALNVVVTGIPYISAKVFMFSACAIAPAPRTNRGFSDFEIKTCAASSDDMSLSHK